MQRRSISQSYGVVGTSWQLDSQGGRHGRDHFQYRAPKTARREQFQAVLAAFRETLDAFVSNRMRRAAAEAGHIRPRLPPGTSSPSLNAR